MGSWSYKALAKRALELFKIRRREGPHLRAFFVQTSALLQHGREDHFNVRGATGIGDVTIANTTGVLDRFVP